MADSLPYTSNITTRYARGCGVVWLEQPSHGKDKDGAEYHPAGATLNTVWKTPGIVFPNTTRNTLGYGVSKYRQEYVGYVFPNTAKNTLATAMVATAVSTYPRQVKSAASPLLHACCMEIDMRVISSRDPRMSPCVRPRRSFPAAPSCRVKYPCVRGIPRRTPAPRHQGGRVYKALAPDPPVPARRLCRVLHPNQAWRSRQRGREQSPPHAEDGPPPLWVCKS